MASKSAKNAQEILMADFQALVRDTEKLLADTANKFFDRECLPNDARWRAQHGVGKDIWRQAGDMGLLCLDLPAEYGCGGGDFRLFAVLIIAGYQPGKQHG